MKVSTVIKHCSTGVDNETYDYIRIGTIISVIVLIVFTGYHLFANRQFDPMNFGSALGILFGGSGVGVGAKYKTEPPILPKADNPDF